MKNSLLIYFLFIVVSVQGQEWFMDNSHWVYRWTNGYGGHDGYSELYLTGKDTIDNKIYYSLSGMEVGVPNEPPTNDTASWNTGLNFYVENDIVFANIDGNYVPQFDFNLVVGDIFLLPYGDGLTDTMAIEVDSTGVMDVQGVSRRFQILNPPNHWNFGEHKIRVIEGLGATHIIREDNMGNEEESQWGFLVLSYLYNSVVDGEYWSFCHFNNDDITFGNPLEDCKALRFISASEELDLGLYQLTIEPNPTRDIIRFDCNFNIDKIELFSISGERLAIVKGEKTIYISNCPPGIYLTKVYSNQKILTGKIVKH